MPWPEVLHDFDCFSSVNPQYEPMRQLVYALHSCAATELHATQTMGGNLLLSPEKELHFDDNVLLISFRPEERLFQFEHRTLSKKNDVKYASIEEAPSVFRLFVGYKFGIRIPEVRPNVTAP
jgi:hypothetical protein